MPPSHPRSTAATETARPLRVMVADGDEFMRNALAAALEGDREIKVVGKADRFDSVALAIEAGEVDVLLLDMHLPGLEGPDAAGQIDERHGPGIVLLGVAEDVSVATEFVLDSPAGRAFLPKLGVGSAERLGRMVHTVADGSSVFDPELMRHIRGSAPGTPHGLSALTGREREVLACISRGLSNSAIAAELWLSSRTVQNNVGTIFSKLSVRGIADVDPRVTAVLYFLASTGRMRPDDDVSQGDGVPEDDGISEFTLRFAGS